MTGKRVLLIIGGGIAAYKSLELVRELGRRGVGVSTILTASAQHFVTPLSVSALSGEKVYSDLFDLTDEAEMGHIELSRSADLIVVCPATANIMAKAAAGLCDDLATTTLLATDTQVMFVPAMNVRMWEHAATQANIHTLRTHGAQVMEPDEGAMACGEFGPGRLPETSRILAAIEDQLAGGATRPLSGRHVLITAGPTREPVDPVRYLSNHSSGRQGFAIAGALAELGAKVTLVAGPVELATPPRVTRVNVQTATDMLEACQNALPADVFIGVAAVADWRPATSSPVKLKGKQAMSALELVENPDILAMIAADGPMRPGLVIGFAAETNTVEANAREKRTRKNCDWIIANDVSGDVMGGSENEALIITESRSRRLPRAAKHLIARDIAAEIAEALGTGSVQ